MDVSYVEMLSCYYPLGERRSEETHRSMRQIEAERAAAAMKAAKDVRRRPGKSTCSP